MTKTSTNKYFITVVMMSNRRCVELCLRYQALVGTNNVSYEENFVLTGCVWMVVLRWRKSVNLVCCFALLFFAIVPYGNSSVNAEQGEIGNRVVNIASGEFHSLALKADGTVVAWGRNDEGQTDVPPGLSEVVAIAAGDSHSLALKADGTVEAWGRND